MTAVFIQRCTGDPVSPTFVRSIIGAAPATATYVMLPKKNGVYRIVDGETGATKFSGPDAIDITNELLASIPADESGITLHLKKGRFTGAGTITVPTEFSLTIRGEAHVHRIYLAKAEKMGTMLETTGTGPLISTAGTSAVVLVLKDLHLNIDNDGYGTCLDLTDVGRTFIERVSIYRRGFDVGVPTVPNVGSKGIYLPTGLRDHIMIRYTKIMGYEWGIDCLADFPWFEACLVIHSNEAAFRINSAISLGNAPILVRCQALWYGEDAYRITGTGHAYSKPTMISCAAEGPAPAGFKLCGMAKRLTLLLVLDMLTQRRH